MCRLHVSWKTYVTKVSRLWMQILLAFITIGFVIKFSYTANVLDNVYDVEFKNSKEMTNDDDYLIGKELLRSSKETTFNRCIKTIGTENQTIDKWKIHPRFCTPDISIILLIKSSIVRNTLRQALRNTWTQEVSTNFGKVKRIFVVGSARENQSIALIDEESLKYNDILQGYFEDIFGSVTRKVLMGMRFIRSNCPHVKRIIVADDDAMVLPWNFYSFLNITSKLNNENELYFAGFPAYGSNPVRDKNNRWFVSEDDYNCTNYPLYPFGTVFVLSLNTVRLFLRLSQVVRAFFFDDVYFGVLAKISNVSLIGYPGDRYSSGCMDLFSGHSVKTYSNLIACHGIEDAKEHIKIWSELCYSSTSNEETKRLLVKYCSHIIHHIIT